jgi:hypothetical protein
MPFFAVNLPVERQLYNQLLFTFCDQAFDAARQRVLPRGCLQSGASARQRLVPERPFFFMHFAIFPYLEGAVRRAAQVQTAVNQARIACALTRFHQARGRYPETLNQLSPAFLKFVPQDLIGGQPLRYRPTDDGRFILYSVGWDEKDDGGLPSGAPSGFGSGDWLWPAI